MTPAHRPGHEGKTADDAPPSCALCAAAGKTCCSADPEQAHINFPLSPAERQRLDAARHKVVSGLHTERSEGNRGKHGPTVAFGVDTGKPSWTAHRNTPDFISAMRALFPRDKRRIDELFPTDGEHRALRLRPDGACIFLGGDGCRLPRAARPGYCLLFPVWIIGGTLTLFLAQECLIARSAESPARCAGLMGTDRAGLSLLYARLRREWGLDAER
jgi:Fe-S-cluster containining protein